MFRLEFKAKIITASRNKKDNYYMVGLADDKFDYKNYILFQRPITLSEDDDPESELNGIYAECNGDVTYNTCKSVSLTNESVVFEVQDSLITVDLSDVKLNKRFVEYSKEIFKELLTTNCKNFDDIGRGSCYYHNVIDRE